MKYSALARDKGMTDYKVSKLTGIPSICFSDWKLGKCNPSMKNLVKLARFFDVPIDHFIK